MENAAKAANVDFLWLLACAIEQSRLQYDAWAINRREKDGRVTHLSVDVGLFQINCGPTSPYCKYGSKKSLSWVMNLRVNAALFVDWIHMKKNFCERKNTLRCRVNKRLHGVAVPMFHPKKTRKILNQLRKFYGEAR